MPNQQTFPLVEDSTKLSDLRILSFMNDSKKLGIFLPLCLYLVAGFLIVICLLLTDNYILFDSLVYIKDCTLYKVWVIFYFLQTLFSPGFAYKHVVNCTIGKKYCWISYYIKEYINVLLCNSTKSILFTILENRIFLPGLLLSYTSNYYVVLSFLIQFVKNKTVYKFKQLFIYRLWLVKILCHVSLLPFCSFYIDVPLEQFNL